MKKITGIWSFLVVFLFTLSSCELVGDIFEAGMFVGILAVVLVIGLIIWIFNRLRR